MATNQLNRYVWLVDTLRRCQSLSFDEIDQLWQKSCLNHACDPLPKRTFNNHRKAIAEIFGVEIACDRHYRYFIGNPDEIGSGSLRNWFIDSYSIMNQIQVDKELSRRIIIDEVPSGRYWLLPLAEAVRNRRVLKITHWGFEADEPRVYLIEPHYLKMHRLRWYLIGRTPAGKFLTLGLDRIKDAEETGEGFVFDMSFDVEEYFRGRIGMMPAQGEPERIVVKAYDSLPEYLRTLPLHSSQRELPELQTEDVSFFEYTLSPNFEFYQALFSQLDLLQVVEPASVRQQLKTFAQNLLTYYS